MKITDDQYHGLMQALEAIPRTLGPSCHEVPGGTNHFDPPKPPAPTLWGLLKDLLSEQGRTNQLLAHLEFAVDALAPKPEPVEEFLPEEYPNHVWRDAGEQGMRCVHCCRPADATDFGEPCLERVRAAGDWEHVGVEVDAKGYIRLMRDIDAERAVSPGTRGHVWNQSGVCIACRRPISKLAEVSWCPGPTSPAVGQVWRTKRRPETNKSGFATATVKVEALGSEAVYGVWVNDTVGVGQPQGWTLEQFLKIFEPAP